MQEHPAFVLDPRLAQDSVPVSDLDLCTLRLMNDSRYPWLLLIPKQPGLREIIDLPATDRQRLYQELDRCAETLRAVTGAHKLNVAALGNLVPQLHVHIIARFEDDAAWPGPVWGLGTAVPYDEQRRIERLSALLEALG